MRIPDSLLWAMHGSSEGSKTLSGIQIYCEKALREEIVREFPVILKREYYNERSSTEFAYCENLLESIEETAYGVCIRAGAFSMFVTEEMCLSPCCCCFDDALELLLERYPSIRILGYIGYAWQDMNGGAVVQYEVKLPDSWDGCPEDIGGQEAAAYSFMGDKLAQAMQSEGFYRSYERHAVAEESEAVKGFLEQYADKLEDKNIRRIVGE